jgi:flagellar protein FlaF
VEIERKYGEAAADSSAALRGRELAAFDRAIQLLVMAQADGSSPQVRIEAIHFTDRLWSVLLEDLAEEGNSLPGPLKAALISIGIWILRRLESVRRGTEYDLTAIVDVNRAIRAGIGSMR